MGGTGPIDKRGPPVAPAQKKQATAAPAQAKKPVEPADVFREGVAADLKKGDDFADDLIRQAEQWVQAIEPPSFHAPVVDPFDALALVKNGDVEMSFALNEGRLFNVSGTLRNLVGVDVRPGTTVKVSAHVKGGEVDLKGLKIEIDPPLDGVAWLDIRGAKVDAAGKLAIDIAGFPDPELGPKLPSKLSEFAQKLSDLGKPGSKIPVGFFGVEVASLAPGFKTKEQLAKPKSTSSASEEALAPDGNNLQKLIIPEKTRLSVKNVEFAGGKVPLGGAGELTVAPGTRFDIEGTAADLCLKASVGIKDLTLNRDGVRLEGAGGSAKIEARYTRNERGEATASVAIDDLTLETRYAVTKRANGDFIALADGSIEGGRVRVEEMALPAAGGQGSRLHMRQATVDVEKFGGRLLGARLTIPDAKDTAQITVGESKVKGSFHIDPTRILFEGSLDAKLAVQDYQSGPAGRGGASFNVDLKRAALAAKGKVGFDSRSGLTLSGGQFALAAELGTSSASAAGLGATISAHIGAGSKIGLTATQVTLSRQRFHAEGDAVVDLKMEDLDLGRGGFGLTGKNATIAGRARAVIDGDEGVTLAEGNLSLDASFADFKVDFPGVVEANLSGAKLALTLKLDEVKLSRDGSVWKFAPGTKISGALEGGRFVRRDGKPVEFRSGGSVELVPERFELDAEGRVQRAQGALTVSFDLGGDELPISAELIPKGPRDVAIKGVKSRVVVTIPKFAIADGHFELEGTEVRVDASAGKVTGQLGP